MVNHHLIRPKSFPGNSVSEFRFPNLREQSPEKKNINDPGVVFQKGRIWIITLTSVLGFQRFDVALVVYIPDAPFMKYSSTFGKKYGKCR